MRIFPLIPVALLIGVLPAQQLRRAVHAADVVVVATDVGVRPIGERYIVHSLRFEETLKGKPDGLLSVLELKGVSLHQRPAPAQRRLYCLHDATRSALEAGLPASRAPYYKMSGHPGSNPPVEDIAKDEAIALARIVVDAENGTAARRLTERLMPLALSAEPGLRTEAVELLTERRSLLDALDPLQMSDLTARAVAETDDVLFKIALASLCAERRVEGLVDALCIGLGEIEDPAFAQTLGRIAARLHGERATEALQHHLARTKHARTRSNLLLAMGATSSDEALEALLRLKPTEGRDEAVEAALRLHGGKRALDAVGK